MRVNIFIFQYVQESVLPAPSMFEQDNLSTLASFVFFSKVATNSSLPSIDLVQFREKFAFCIKRLAIEHFGQISWWLLNQKLQKTTMLWTQSTIQHPANNNYNVQIGVAKDQKNFGLQIFFIRKANFSQNFTTSDNWSLNRSDMSRKSPFLTLFRILGRTTADVC